MTQPLIYWSENSMKIKPNDRVVVTKIDSVDEFKGIKVGDMGTVFGDIGRLVYVMMDNGVTATLLHNQFLVSNQVSKHVDINMEEISRFGFRGNGLEEFDDGQFMLVSEVIAYILNPLCNRIKDLENELSGSDGCNEYL